MSTASVWVGAILLAVIVLAHHDLFREELGVGARLSALVDRVRRRRPTSTTTMGEHLLFLLGLALGGLAASVATGTFAIHRGLGSDRFAAIFEGRVDAATALFLGGLFVGAGMRLGAPAFGAHGLLSLTRFDRSTAVATFVFALAAIVVSLALEAFR